MENASEVCVSDFFFSPTVFRERINLFNDNMDQELFEVGEQIENMELFDSACDDELYNQCAMIEAKMM